MSNVSSSLPEPSLLAQAMRTPPSTLAVVGSMLVVLVTVVARAVKPNDKTAIYDLGGFSIATAWPFFTQRFDFLQRNWKKTGQSMFQFRVLQHRVVAVSGDDARRVFFNDKSLNFTEGYKILMGGAPDAKAVVVEHSDGQTVSAFIRRLATLLRKERLNDMLPTLFEDMHERMKEWGNEGQINPFRDVYDLVFQMTVRMASCGELAKNRAEVARLAQLYWTLEKSATPTALLMPWLPSRAKREKEESTRGMYELLSGYVDLRRKAEEPGSDAIDVLIKDGLDNFTIVSFMMGTIFAGVINTGINSCWVLMYLAAHPEWKAKVKSELSTMMSKNGCSDSSEPLHARLAAIPVEAWDEGMPAVEACIRETLRLIINGAALRRNIEDDLMIEGRTVPKGAFLAYSVSDVHLNGDIYTDPFKFDPSRYDEGREEDKKRSQAYLAWGTGRHPCAGMRVAKLEMKMIIALFLMGYEYELVDSTGKFPQKFPEPDRNDIQQARPLGEPCFLKFKKMVD